MRIPPLISRAAVLLVLSAVVSVLVAGCADHKQSPAGSTVTPSTTQRVFAAYGADGRVTAPIAARASGECFATSIAVPGSGVFRCLAGNTIQDPCFAPPAPAASTTLACLSSPWSSATLLTVTGTLPTASSLHLPARPWALQLAGGARCVASTGTVPSVAGVALNYACGPSADAGIVASGATPSEVYYAAPTATVLTMIAIDTSWTG